MATIKEYVQEFELIDKELKRLNGEIRKLRNRRKECQTHILKYIEDNNHPGIKFNQTVIIPKSRKTRKRGTKTECQERVHSVLNKYNIRGNETMIKDILEAYKGEEQTSQNIQIYNN
jgi:hypothetical protein